MLGSSSTGLHDRRECTLQDWENLKAHFSDAIEYLEGENIVHGIHLLRTVMRECNRFLSQYRDPAVLFSTPTAANRAPSPGALTPTEERLDRDWGGSEYTRNRQEQVHTLHRVHRAPSTYDRGHEHLSGALRIKGEQPTAFHSIYGCTLFLFGHILASYPAASLVEDGEVKDPNSYFMAAIEVFEQAESLPIMTTRSEAATRNTLADKNRAHLEDWLMAVAWGRTLVALTQGHLPGSSGARYPSQNSRHPSASSPRSFILLPLNLHDSTPSPHTQSTMNAHDLLMQAQDHFMRGIFHMPHSVPKYSSNHPPLELSTSDSSRRLSGEIAQQPPSPRYSPPNRPRTRASMRATMSPGPGTPPKTLTKTPTPRPSLHLAMGASSSSRSDRTDCKPHMSRPRTLFTIGSEVLKVAERLLPSVSPSPALPSHPHPGSLAASPAHIRVMRQRERDCVEWAEYADSVFMQLENELKVGGKARCVSPSMVSAARGRCFQITGHALAANRDAPTDNTSGRSRGMSTSGRNPSTVDREEAPFYLRKAMECFDLALRQLSLDGATHVNYKAKESQAISSSLVDTILTLLDLTSDPAEQNTLYAQATALSSSISYSSREK